MILYKYLKPERIDVLRNKSIRFTQPGAFNDVFEFRPHIEQAASGEEIQTSTEKNWEKVLEDELDKYGAMIEGVSKNFIRDFVRSRKDQIPELIKLLQPELLKKLAPDLNNILNVSIGALSLSEINDSQTMWAHYAEDNQGFVIGFNSENEFFSKRRSDKDEFGFLRKVIYRSDRPQITLSDTSSPDWFQTKSVEWESEKEWRIVRPLKEAVKCIECSRFPIYLFDFPAEAVQEVIVGMHCSVSLQSEIAKLMPAFPRTSLCKIEESETGYGLEVKQVL